MNRTLKFVGAEFDIWMFWGETAEDGQTTDWTASSQGYAWTFSMGVPGIFELSDWDLFNLLLTAVKAAPIWIDKAILTQEQSVAIFDFEQEVYDLAHPSEPTPFPSKELNWAVPQLNWEEQIEWL